MISVTVGSGLSRKAYSVDPERTLKSVLDEHQINYSVAPVHLDGSSVSSAELNKTFTEMGVVDSCYLIAVVKSDNA